jgi:hypothetical protein
VNRGWRDISSVIRPLFDGAEMNDDGGDSRRRTTAVDVALGTPFTLVNRCSKNSPKTAIFAILPGLRRGLQAETLAQQHLAASSDRAQWVLGRAIQKPCGYRCIQTAISIRTDCTLSQIAHHGTRPAGVGVTGRHPVWTPPPHVEDVERMAGKIGFAVKMAAHEIGATPGKSCKRRFYIDLR